MTVRCAWRELAFWVALVVFAGVFLIANAPARLASDDVQWLRGEVPAPTDNYRVIPRAVMCGVGLVFGESRTAALGTLFPFHALNALLIYRLALDLTDSEKAARVAAFALAVNPLTLHALTWTACLSYVLGTTLALAALVAAWRGRWGLALVGYAAVVFSSHEILFLPVAFLALAWLRGDRRRGLAAGGVSVALGAAAWVFVYDFGRYGLPTGNLASVAFAGDVLFSAVSLAPAMALAYPLSFVAKGTDVLVALTAGPGVWLSVVALVTTAVAVAGKRGARRRVWAVLAAGFAAAVVPYAARVYLLPANAAYCPAYLLGGRVFYWPFAFVAVALGLSVRRVPGWLLVLLAVAGFAAALWLYGPADFRALEMVVG